MSTLKIIIEALNKIKDEKKENLEDFNCGKIKEIVKSYCYSIEEEIKLKDFFSILFEEDIKDLQQLINKKEKEIIDNKLDDIFFTKIKSTLSINVKFLGNIFINYLRGKSKLTIKRVINYTDLVSNFPYNQDIILAPQSYKGKKFYSEDAYKYLLNLNMVCINKYGHYELKKEGEIFLDSLYIVEVVKDEWKNLIDVKQMEQLLPVLEHKKYFDYTLKMIENNNVCIEKAKAKFSEFKWFFEDYINLINYAMTKHGSNCEIKFCGNNTKNKPHYDGLIKYKENEEKIELTISTTNIDKVRYKRDLKLRGWGSLDVSSGNIPQIYREISSALNSKIKNFDNYDETINLVIIWDNYVLPTYSELEFRKDIENVFKTLKEKEYSFKTIEILFNESTKNDIKSWIYTIK